MLTAEQMHAWLKGLVGKPIYYTFIGFNITVGVLSVIYLICLFVYGFFNPDSEAWLGTLEDKRTIFGSLEAVKEQEAIHVTNIHKRYVSWFAWGFFNWFVPPISILITYYSYKLNSVCGMVGFVISGCWGACSILLWLILGLAWRFSYDGQFSAGTLIPEGTNTDWWEHKIHADDSVY